MTCVKFALLCSVVALAAASSALAAAAPTVVPDRFLRRWDPVTLFFDRPVGPAGGGAEDVPARLVSLAPAHPGAWTWLDGKTLQFKPAEPWRPLHRVAVASGGRVTSLLALLSAPAETRPRDGAEGLEPQDAIALTFPDPVEPAALAKVVSVEVRPLPGVEGGEARWLSAKDFTVKAPEAATGEGYSYELRLREPLPCGVRAVVHLRLAPDDAGAPFARISFATAVPFRVVAAGLRVQRVQLGPAGTRYGREQALRGAAFDREVQVHFSAEPAGLGPVEARNLVRLTPPVDGLAFAVEGTRLRAAGAFAPETLYRCTLEPVPLRDKAGRALDMGGASEFWFWLPRLQPFLQWQGGGGLVERYGPRMVPVKGRGHERVDVRVHRVEPLDRSWWPWPGAPVLVDESRRPPGPGEEPAPPAEGAGAPSSEELRERLRALGTPAVSALLDLPLRGDGAAASFGLDLAPLLDRVAPRGAAGTWLVGLRRLDAGSERAWIRVQASDLCLTTVEELSAVRFVVTSLRTGAPVPGATVRGHGPGPGPGAGLPWVTLVEGTTGSDGSFVWAPPSTRWQDLRLRRLAVTAGDDVLVLDPAQPPDAFQDGRWGAASGSSWLAHRSEGPQPAVLAHLFPERPIYRPEEPVLLKGWLRVRRAGRLELPALQKVWLHVRGPGDLEWTYERPLTAAGAFHHRFKEEKLPTGEYSVHVEDEEKNRYGHATFRLEAYRVPSFEVRLDGPDQAPLDRPFAVSLAASYYAGGPVAGRPVRWRVTQFPQGWKPPGREGFLFSSDERYSGRARFVSSPAREEEAETDDEGAASLELDPSAEPTAQARAYVVEATVTGADEQTSTATCRVAAVPAFVLGLKAPRFLPRAARVEPEVLVLAHDGAPRAGVPVQVRLLERQWHAVLRAGDFAAGEARYQTDVVDEPVGQASVVSTTAPLAVPFDLPHAGVYVVELEARDEQGRAQRVAVDLYAGGPEPVTWRKPASEVFAMVADREAYDPGQTAQVVLQSPFQQGRALAVIEEPDGQNLYEWLEVSGGAATLRVPVKPTYVPRVPLHVVLWRGRLPGTEPVPGTTVDLGKPVTVAGTTWLTVNPVENRVAVALEAPERARPGQEIAVTVRLADGRGKPLPGEVTLWLVDQAVLSLGREARLDPLPDFVRPVRSWLLVRDTRGMAFGFLPVGEQPGGDEGEEAAKEGRGLLDRATVRRRFESVPYYEPALAVGADGAATVRFTLPDNLTVFKLRAKAASGPDRFGAGTGQVAVRLPVVAQPSLPRFVRPGDRFTAAVIGRVVEGAGGAGAAEIRAEHLDVAGSVRQDLLLEPPRAARAAFDVSVPTPPPTTGGAPAWDEARVTMGVSRASDGASDGFEVVLPVVDDRQRVTRSEVFEVVRGKPLVLPALTERARPGTLRRTLLLARDPALIKMAAGLDMLLACPYRCTEQRVSQATVRLAFRKLQKALHQEGDDRALERTVRETLAYLPSAVDPHGLVAYWPGARGYVSLTAWVLEFLVEARRAGYPVDDGLYDGAARTLEQSLRSDYSWLVDGGQWYERCVALLALARAGRTDRAYGAELARKADLLDVEGRASTLLALAGGEGAAAKPVLAALTDRVWSGVVFKLYQGRKVYGGLAAGALCSSGLVLPSEAKTLAVAVRALTRTAAEDPRVRILRSALVTLGQGDGWGSTHADAAALLALAEGLEARAGGVARRSFEVTWGSTRRRGLIEAENPTDFLELPAGERVELTVGDDGTADPLAARVETSYVPEAAGSEAPGVQEGFAVTRELLRVARGGGPSVRESLARAGLTTAFAAGDVVEDHVQVVNPEERHYVAVVMPFAAGLEPLNPKLATAPPEAAPAGRLTLEPTYVAALDDAVSFYYDTLPKGTYDFYFRVRAQVPGSFTQPGARAEQMYRRAVRGQSPGARLVVAPAAP